MQKYCLKKVSTGSFYPATLQKFHAKNDIVCLGGLPSFNRVLYPCPQE